MKKLKDFVFIRQFAKVIPIANADSLGIPTLETDPADADWTSEVSSVSEDTSMAVGKRELKPHLLSKLIKVSMKLLRVSMVPVDELINDRLGYKFSVTEEKAFLAGNGSGQPLGLFTASSDGISTDRDVSTGNTTTEIRFDGLIEAKYKIKEQYQARARWIFHRDAIKQIAKLKDGEGRYIWQPSQTVGQPDSLLGKPFHVSEYAPNTFETGLYVGIYGDLWYYWIADAAQFSIQRLVELYAANNKVGFIGRRETDGMPIFEEPFARVKLA